MKVLSLFSGIGAFEKALDNLEIPYELVAYCEIDKYASKSYAAIHSVSEEMNLGDITKVDAKKLPKDIDLLTYGFPCQDISLAGKQKGLFNEDGSQTRSGLFFEALRIIEETQPKVAIAENVKNLTSKKFSEQFKIVLESLEAAGYNNYWQVLNAKDYGVPQNRERVFIVSIRKDVDTGIFKFPEGFPLELRLKDVLEDEVDEKYYLSETAIAGFSRHAERHSAKGNGFGWNPTDGNVVANTLLSSANCRPSDNFVLVREATKQGYAKAFEGDSINLEQPNSKTRRGRVGHGVAQTLTTSPQQAVVEAKTERESKLLSAMNEIAQNSDLHGTVIYDAYNNRIKADQTVIGTLTTNIDNDALGNGTKLIENGGLRIRKLTPKECFRLMGFDDADFEKAAAVNSNTQLYKQAGNSIVVPVLEHLITSISKIGVWKERDVNENNSVRKDTQASQGLRHNIIIRSRSGIRNTQARIKNKRSQEKGI